MTVVYDLVLVALVALALVAICAAVLRAVGQGGPLVVLELAARDRAAADRANWTQLFDQLAGVQRASWRSLLFGPPSLVIELWAAQGRVGVRWVVPAEFETVVRSLVETSLPGIVVIAGD